MTNLGPATIERYMSPSPHTIGSDQPLSAAHRLMQRYDIRHLPVLKGGRIVGVVSQRDLHLMETLPGVHADELSVEEAMSQDVYSVHREAPLAEVAREMATRKLGSAVVLERNKVVGVFTTVDALHALSDALELAVAS
jgi:acetoin utilization protein AcuB